MNGPRMLKVSGFYDNSCTNGEGWRSVVFFSGCPHRCIGCQNPSTWDYNSGDSVSVEELTQKVLYNLPMIDGVTLSGGEPFQERNINEILTFVHKIKEEGLNLWCYTGYSFDDLVDHPSYSLLLKEIDVLIDGKYKKDLYDPSLRFRGSSNQRIIDVKKSLLTKSVVEYYDNLLERA